MKLYSLAACVLISLCTMQGALAANPRITGILGGSQNQYLHNPDLVLNAFRSKPVTLYNKPNNQKDHKEEPVKEVAGNELYSMPYNDNRVGPIVYGYEPYSWYMVGYEGRAWWIETLPNISFYSYYELLRGNRAFIKHWNWELYTEPGGSETIAIDPDKVRPAHHTRPPVEISDSLKIGDELWIRVRVMDSECYEVDRPAQVVATGWLPAYTKEDDTSLWFHTRKCSS